MTDVPTAPLRAPHCEAVRTTSGSGPRPSFLPDACLHRVHRGRFWFHYGVLFYTVLAIGLASALSFAFHKLRVPLKGFREGEFTPVTVVSQAGAMMNFIIFLMVCDRCISPTPAHRISYARPSTCPIVRSLDRARSIFVAQSPSDLSD